MYKELKGNPLPEQIEANREQRAMRARVNRLIYFRKDEEIRNASNHTHN